VHEREGPHARGERRERIADAERDGAERHGTETPEAVGEAPHDTPPKAKPIIVKE
jgi:hypothetical protein